MLFVCYSHCSTCAKARKWLDENDIDFTERDIKGDNPTAMELKRWWKASGLPLKRFFNTSGMPYREMKLKTKLPEMSEDEQLKLLATNGMLVKRPIIVNANKILVGFRPETWKNALSSTEDQLK
ncbi:arsenate reductase family protein [Bifidobacterium sp. ESL0784]|uniref:arsenate reductase family protein n=1 Tax=Bifidobacterium sp. ESL0784 TaxID=2983231 RepID=UPI0032AFA606